MMGEDTVLGGETTCLLDLPSAGSKPSSIYSRQLLNGGRDCYSPNEDGPGEDSHKGSTTLPWPANGVHAYQAQPPATSARDPTQNASVSSSSDRQKTRFPSLMPAPGSFRAASGSGRDGDTRASEAVAHARKTWAPPALRTQAVASYGAVPDLEVIPEDSEVRRFHARAQVRRYTDLGCPSCAIS